jgi:hypothetical protein
MTVQEAPNDIFVNVYASLKTTHAADFYGFTSALRYDTTKLRAVSVEFVGACTENAQYHFGNARPLGYPGETRAVALNQTGSPFNLANPLLYSVRFTVLSKMQDKDTAVIEHAYFDAIQSQTHIDSVRLLGGWVRLEKPVIPPVRVDLQLTSRDTSVAADSEVMVPVGISDMTGAKLKQALFTFEFDPKVLVFKDALPGMLDSGGLRLSVLSTGNSASILISSVDSDTYMRGAGLLTTLIFKALAREDTACSDLIDPALVPKSGEALIKSTGFSLGSICVNGVVKPKEAVGVRASAEAFAVSNPFGAVLRLRGKSSDEYTVVLIDALGKERARLTFRGDIVWHVPPGLAVGVYTMVIRSREGAEERIKLLHLD